MVDKTFRSQIVSKDLQNTKTYLHALNLQKQLIPILNDLLYSSILVKQSSEITLHPVCVINSIKNIIGDNRHNPSLTLIEFCLDYLLKFDFRNEDQSYLDEVAKEGLGLTAFLGDLEDACQQGDWDVARSLTAKTFLASDQSRGVMDSLCELALQDSLKSSLFIFHVLRAYQFQEAKKDNWAYTKCIFDWLSQQHLPAPHSEENVTPDMVFDSMINGGDLNWFAAAARLWDGDYVRIRSYKRELSFGFSQCNIHDQTVVATQHHWLNSDNKSKYIEVAERIVSSENSKIEKANQVVILESVRALSRLATHNQNNILGARLDNHL